MKRILFYDCEIINNPNVHGWQNYKALGICAIGCYANWLPKDRRLQCFTVDGGFDGFQKLVNQADEIVGFNSLGFDDPLCQAHGIHIETTFDLMVEVRRAAGEPLSGKCTPGYNLARLSEVNLGRQKTGHGSKVPDLWQAGEKQAVIDYCLNDVELLRDLYFRRTRLIDPVRYGDVVLHCDPSLTNWWETWGRLINFIIEGVIKIEFPRNWHWSGVKILKIQVTLLSVFSIKFPIWLFPMMGWRAYTGLPFKKPRLSTTLPIRKPHPDDGIDPIPF